MPGDRAALRRWVHKWYPVRDATDRIVAAGVTVEDVTLRVTAERRHAMLMDELTHRVKNTLAVVQAMAVQTLRPTPDVASFTEAFSRLLSLARAHDLLTRDAWSKAGLKDIVDTALAPFGNDGGQATGPSPRVHVTGPPVELPANMTITLTLMLHELATNAAKYGALSRAEGQVQIRWEVSQAEAEDPIVRMTWTERMAP